MKKIFIILSVFLIAFLVGCGSEEDTSCDGGFVLKDVSCVVDDMSDKCALEYIKIYSNADENLYICKLDSSVIAPEHEVVYQTSDKSYGFAYTISSKYRVHINEDILTLADFFESGVLTDSQLLEIPFENDLFINEK